MTRNSDLVSDPAESEKSLPPYPCDAKAVIKPAYKTIEIWTRIQREQEWFMPRYATNISCEEFQEQIPELLAFSSDSDPEDHPHAKA